MSHYVYTLFDKAGRLVYIGRSNDPKARRYMFEWKHGFSVKLGPMQRFSTIEQAQEAELKAIAKYWPPYNKHLVSSIGRFGVSPSEETRAKMRAKHIGKIMSPEARAKMSAAKIGKKPWCTGLKMTPEHCAKLSAAHKGKPLTQAQIDGNRRAALKRVGRKLTAESRAKIGAANRKVKA